jgi:hypothetical protein
MLLPVFLACLRVGPAPPSHQVGDEEKHLQEHIRIQLYLIKQKEQQHHINDADRPAPDIGPC